jgi:hypothetical protein
VSGPSGRSWPGEARWFALHHLYVYPRVGIAYTYIPKNACTSFKKTFGRAQGWLPKGRGGAHEMKISWWVSGLRAYRSADEYIVVLRDPFDRLLSAYQNRFLTRDDPASAHAMRTGLGDSLPRGGERSDVTFGQFVRYLAATPDHRLNEHWRPQATFLIGTYSRVIRFDHLDEDTGFLAGRGLQLKRARGHSTSTLREDVGPGWGHRPAGDLAALKAHRKLLPSATSMYDAEIRESVRHRFAADVALWERYRLRPAELGTVE